MTNDKFPALNTDRVVWEETPNDYYSDKMFVTEEGGIGINHGGHAVVMSAQSWIELSNEAFAQKKRIEWLERLFKFEDADEVLNTGPNDSVTRDCVVVRSDYYRQLAPKATPSKDLDHGAKILESLRQAVDGDFARVTIEGQTWVREHQIRVEDLVVIEEEEYNSIPSTGWTFFHGRDEGCPFEDRDTLIYVLYRDGKIVGPRRAQRFLWLHQDEAGENGDVMAYAEAEK